MNNLWTHKPPFLTDNEKWEIIRKERNNLISSCDWTQLPDAPITPEKIDQWAVYRQELRDIPQNFTDPDSVELPIKPL